ncbi:MAG TPA: ABC-type transport auxiliary lipoprotein family protein [Wenzhouxiangella sp.]|nr:ABC-type transport auxiliary lipoprotein family protein [Wenzhouxiangella sp.]
MTLSNNRFIHLSCVFGNNRFKQSFCFNQFTETRADIGHIEEKERICLFVEKICSPRILVRRDRVLLPWPEAAWIDRAPDLVQDLLVAYLDGRVATVGRYGSLPADYRLELVVTRFELADRADGLQSDVAIVARLFEASGRLLATTRAEGRTPASGTSLEDAVAAMEAGMGQVFGELAGWLHDRLDGRDAG